VPPAIVAVTIPPVAIVAATAPVAAATPTEVEAFANLHVHPHLHNRNSRTTTFTSTTLPPAHNQVSSDANYDLPVNHEGRKRTDVNNILSVE
jgi:hypothetical protein